MIVDFVFVDIISIPVYFSEKLFLEFIRDNLQFLWEEIKLD